MDVLSNILSSVQLASEIYMSVEMSAPWGVSFPDQPGRALFYVVSRGSCYAQLDRGKSVALVGGDVIMLPFGSPHTMRDRPDSLTEPVEHVVNAGTTNANGLFRYGGGGEKCSLIVGRFRFETIAAIRLLANMPPMIYLPHELSHASSGLAATLRLFSTEANRRLPGHETVMNRLATVLFIHILRAFVTHEEEEGRPLEQRTGLIQALMDPDLSRAMELMHQRPEHPWTVAELAERVGMSRTAFAVRFKAKAGVGPLEYLTSWRLQKACEMLREGRTTLDVVAWKVGYESAAAFSKAFKRELGVSPGAFRRGDV